MRSELKNRLKSVVKFLKRRIDVNIPLPKNKIGKWLAKDVRWVPKYFSDSYKELKRVVWPDRKETWRMFFAITMFSLVTTAIIVVADNIFQAIVERLFL